MYRAVLLTAGLEHMSSLRVFDYEPWLGFEAERSKAVAAMHEQCLSVNLSLLT